MKLYVGTYRKYNEGSLAGAWLDLDRYASAAEFAKACRELHRDERDPELMFQDCETDPGCDWQEGLYSESSIPCDYWTLKAEFATSATRTTAASQRAEQARLMERYVKDEGYDPVLQARAYERELKYIRGCSYFVELSDGTVLRIEKPTIQTRFCCGENDHGQGGDGYGTMKYARRVLEGRRTERGFKDANIGEFDRRMVRLVGRRAWRLVRTPSTEYRPGDFVPCVMRGMYSDSCHLYFSNAARPGPSEEVVRVFTDDDMRRMRRGYMAVRMDFRRRVNAYWKRFGATKIRTWTYWTEA